MIILDTNVISEIVRPVPDATVVKWLRRQDDDLLFTTSVTEAEIAAGIALAPDGRRKRELGEALQRVFEDLAGKVLPFESISARLFGNVIAVRQKSGRPIDDLDAQIAAIALSHDALLATRNVRDFEGCGVRLVNPWDAA